MKIDKQLEIEWDYLATQKNKAIMISNTAKGNDDFKVLPRRNACDTALACFLINDPQILKETITYFDGKVDEIYIDVEQKQRINYLELSKPLIKNSTFIAVKPNDVAIEACDHLLRHAYNDDLSGKDILVIGTGNLASKIALRMVERQANVYIHGRTKEKQELLIQAVNQFSPRYSEPVKSIDDWVSPTNKSFDSVISFITGTYWAEDSLLSSIDEQTFIVDGGISNFSSQFIEQILTRNITLARVDVRFALTYQFMSTMRDTVNFHENIFGKKYHKNICLVAGGYLGEEGAVIVDQIQAPSQVIGIANGRGGVKQAVDLTEKDQLAIETIQTSIKIDTP